MRLPLEANTWRFSLVAGALCIALTGPQPAAADTFGIQAPCSANVTTSASPLSSTTSCTSGSTGEIYQGTATSSPGQLGAVLTTTGGGGQFAANDEAYAQFITTVVFSPTTGSTLTTIPVSLNLNITGSLSGGNHTATDWTVTGQLQDALFFSIESNLADLTPPHHTNSGIDFSSGGETLTSTSDIVNGTLTTDTVDLPVGVPVTVGFDLLVTAEASFNSTATADFLDPLNFPVTGIFNLPDGFTANDADGSIVNNNFVTAPATVPEPSSVLLVLSALSGFPLLRRGRRSSKSKPIG